MGKTPKENLLDILVRTRTVKALGEAADKSSAYQETLERQDKAFDALDKSGLNKGQKSIVDRAVSTVNDCGAVAYRLGLQDGLKLASELKEIE